MAITVSLLGTPTFSTASGTKTVTATPAVGDLVVIITAHSGNTSTAAPTDNNSGGGGTYTLVNTAVKAASADTMKVWVRNNLITSATSTVFTHAPGASTGGGLVVIDCQGGDKAGASAIVQSAIQSNIASGTPAPVFGSAVNTQNAVIGAVFNASNPAALTPRTNFTELFDSGYNTPTTGLEVISDNSGETGTTMTWGSTSPSAFASVVVELEASVTHATTGTLTGQIGSVSGSALHSAKHTTTGTLTGQGSSIVGSASNFTPHGTSGTLTGQGSLLAGDADREPMVLPHTSTGVLVGQGSSVVGSSTRFRALSTSGTLTGQGSVIAGDADHEELIIPHLTSGALTGQGAIIVGSSTRYRQFGSSGTLVGQGSSITGIAKVNRPHPSTGTLTGQGSSIVGDAEHTSNTHDSSGTLTGSGSTVTGKAKNESVSVDVIGGTRRVRQATPLIIVEVNGIEYRVPQSQLNAFLQAVKVEAKTEIAKPLKKTKKKRKVQVTQQVVTEPQIVIKSIPVNLIPEVSAKVSQVNQEISKYFAVAMDKYLKEMDDEEVILMLI
tara:strand:+ start:937 stop:2598 length:1662 start_codon:yes stop_codon:yes gene_type:complete